MDAFDSEEIMCRTCLSNGSGEYTNLNLEIRQDFDEEEDATTILDCLHFCLHSESAIMTNLPLHICDECLRKLISSYEFIKMAKNSEAKLLHQPDGCENIENNVIETGSIEIEYINAGEKLLSEDEYTCDLKFNDNDETRDVSYEEVNEHIDEDEEEIDEGEIDEEERDKEEIDEEEIDEEEIDEEEIDNEEIDEEEIEKEERDEDEIDEQEIDAEQKDEKEIDEDEMEIRVEEHFIENPEPDAATNSPTLEKNKQTTNKTMRSLPHQCEQCRFETNSSFNLRRHYVGKHKMYPTIQQLERKDPVNIETSEKNLPHHSKKPSALKKCGLCKRIFKTDYLLNCHVNKHKGLNPYKCQMCSYEGRYLSNLNRHYKHRHGLVATSEMLKPCIDEQQSDCGIIEFACTKCQFFCTTKDELKSHLSCEHGSKKENCIQTGAKLFNPYIYMCSKCSKKFKMLHVLKTHELTCSTEKVSNGSKANLNIKPYECSECSSCFAIPEYLQTHRVVVHRARIHQCHICAKSFKMPSQLKNHVERHKATRTHKCDQCDRSL